MSQMSDLDLVISGYVDNPTAKEQLANEVMRVLEGQLDYEDASDNAKRALDEYFNNIECSFSYDEYDGKNEWEGA